MKNKRVRADDPLQQYSPTEAAQLLGISRAQMYKMLRGSTPQIPYILVGSVKKIRRQDIELWQAQNRRG